MDCKIERDRFDLLALRNVMVSDEDIEHMNMKKSLDSCTICELHRVSSPEVKSKHVVICISGFLQEDQDKSQFWQRLIGYYKHAEVFAVSWNACTPTSFFQAGAFSMQEQQSAQRTKEQRRIFTNFINIVNTAARQFVFAVGQAKLTGILLALFLAQSQFAENRAVTIVGYSLGGITAMHCMRMLQTLHDTAAGGKPGRILNDVHIWAGAYVIDLSKEYEEIKERAQVCRVANGNLNNLYSEKDGVLKNVFTRVFPGRKAIGLYAIFEDIKEEDEEVCKRAINYNMTEDAPGHGFYGSNCGQFMFKVKDAY